MPNGSKQYQQTESDCLRNSDGDAFGRNLVCRLLLEKKKNKPQRNFRKKGISPDGLGAIHGFSAIAR